MRIRDIGNESDKGKTGEFRAIEERLHEEKPALSALELDAIKLRTMNASPVKTVGPIARKKGTFMKSRFALVLVLALGVFMSGTGATLAVSGMSGSGSASSAQYPELPETQHENASHECGESGSGTAGSGSGENCNTPEPEPTCEEQEASGAIAEGSCATQEVRQVSSSGGGSLPFTGFLAIPVLIVGLGLLGAGVAMRLRLRNNGGNHSA